MTQNEWLLDAELPIGTKVKAMYCSNNLYGTVIEINKGKNNIFYIKILLSIKIAITEKEFIEKVTVCPRDIIEVM